MGVLRYDLGTLRPPVFLPNGTVRVDALFTRSGVFEYLNQDGTLRREYRPDSEVFDAKSMQSFTMQPFTDGHPPEALTSANAKQYMVGATGETIRRDADHLLGSIAVYDASTVEKMKHGVTQISCGYEVDLDPTPGTAPNGERYDAVQRNIRGNHVALVAHARAGDTARVRMDAAIQQPRNEETLMDPKEMQKAMEAAIAERDAAKLRADGLDTQLAEATKRADKAEGELESVRVKLTDLEAKRTDEKPEETRAELNILTAKLAASEKLRTDAEAIFPKVLNDAVKSRVKLEQAACVILPKERLDDLDDRQIMDLVVAKLQGISIPTDRSDDYARARFDAAVEGWKAGNTAIDQLRVLARDPDTAIREDAASARAKYVHAQQNAWKTPAKGA